MTYIWLGGVILFAIIEAATMGINFIWFSVGSLAAMIAAMCNAGLWLQFVIFILVSAFALYFTRPLVKKYVHGKQHPTNADRIIGGEGMVTETINNLENRGQIRTNGQIWSAKSSSNDIIAEGEKVKIISISGVKAIVEKII